MPCDAIDDNAPSGSEQRPDIGQRIQLWGDSCSGKSTLAALIAKHHHLELIEMDALNWLPNWVGLNETDPERFHTRLTQATSGDRWVAAGGYTGFAQKAFWHKLDTIIWLDMPMYLLVYRVIVRSWRRARSHELLWGTNTESFWKIFKIWDRRDSLLYWITAHYYRRRRDMNRYRNDQQWSHIRFIHIKGRKALKEWTKVIATSNTAA